MCTLLHVSLPFYSQIAYPVLATSVLSASKTPYYSTGPRSSVDSLEGEMLVTPSPSRSFAIMSTAFKVDIAGKRFMYCFSAVHICDKNTKQKE